MGANPVGAGFAPRPFFAVGRRSAREEGRPARVAPTGPQRRTTELGDAVGWRRGGRNGSVGAGLVPRPSSRSDRVRRAKKGDQQGSPLRSAAKNDGTGGRGRVAPRRSERERRGGACSPPVFAVGPRSAREEGRPARVAPTGPRRRATERGHAVGWRRGGRNGSVGAGLVPRPSSRSDGVRRAKKGDQQGSPLRSAAKSDGTGGRGRMAPRRSERERRGGACSPPVFAVGRRAKKGDQQGSPLRSAAKNDGTGGRGRVAPRRSERERRGGACSPPVFAVGRRSARERRATSEGSPLRDPRRRTTELGDAVGWRRGGRNGSVGAGLVPRPSSRSDGARRRATSKGRPYDPRRRTTERGDAVGWRRGGRNGSVGAGLVPRPFFAVGRRSAREEGRPARVAPTGPRRRTTELGDAVGWRRGGRNGSVGAGLVPRPSSRSDGARRSATSKGRPYGSAAKSDGTGGRGRVAPRRSERERRGGACSPPVFAVGRRSAREEGRPARVAPTGPRRRTTELGDAVGWRRGGRNGSVGAGERRGGACSPPVVPRRGEERRNGGTRSGGAEAVGTGARLRGRTAFGARKKGDQQGSPLRSAAKNDGTGGRGRMAPRRSERERRGGACSPPVFAVGRRAKKGDQQGSPLRSAAKNDGTGGRGRMAPRRPERERRGGACSPPVFAVGRRSAREEGRPARVAPTIRGENVGTGMRAKRRSVRESGQTAHPDGCDRGRPYSDPT